MRIIKTKDYNDMSRKAANYIGALIINKPDCVLGLATGSTPIGTYKNLVAGYENGDYDFSNGESSAIYPWDTKGIELYGLALDKQA